MNGRLVSRLSKFGGFWFDGFFGHQRVGGEKAVLKLLLMQHYICPTKSFVLALLISAHRVGFLIWGSELQRAAIARIERDGQALPGSRKPPEIQFLLKESEFQGENFKCTLQFFECLQVGEGVVFLIEVNVIVSVTPSVEFKVHEAVFQLLIFCWYDLSCWKGWPHW